MKIHTSVPTALRVTKFIIFPFACWPLPPDTKSSIVRWYNIWWYFVFIHLLTVGYASVYNIYLNLNNPYAAIRIATEVSCVVANGVRMTICKIEGPRLQTFLNQATKEEMEIIQFYVDKCALIHLSIVIGCTLGTLAFIGGPVALPQPLPVDTAYPFSTEPLWLWSILYVSHSFAITQVGALTLLDLLYAILLWFAVARFDILYLEFQRATSVDDIKRCIRKHQEILEYTDRLSATTRPMALHVFSYAVFAVTTGGFMLTRKPSLYELMKYVIFDSMSGIQLFVFTWPADTLMDMSGRIKTAAYYSAWIGNPTMHKDILIVSQRSQLPVIIAINGILPALSLELFGSAASATFSYLATLRAMTED